MKIVECIPNFSEGRRPEVVEAIVAPFKNTPGVLLLDVSSDPAHNRTVVTAAGEPDAMVEAAFGAISIAAKLIDMRTHSGEHPRMGATDVVPFVPVQDLDLADCTILARRLARKVGEELHIPIILYEDSATAPHRRNLGEIREGEFEGWHDKIAKPEWAPDFGPAMVHETAGVTAVGGRIALIAYNVNLGTKNVSIARRIANKVREKRGGLTNVRAIGVDLNNNESVQVSMNLTDYTKTPIYRALELVRVEAQRYGVPVIESEIVGLVPMRALTDCASYYLQLAGFSRKQILETRVRSLAAGSNDQDAGEPSAVPFKKMSLDEFTTRLASSSPAPGGGTASAVAVSFAAGLCSMVCRLTLGRQKFKQYETEVREALEFVDPLCNELLDLSTADAEGFDRVMAAFALPKEGEAEKLARQAAIKEATLDAAEIPAKVASLGLKILEITKRLDGKTNPNASSDLKVAALLAEAGLRGALANVRINAKGIDDPRAYEFLKLADQIERAV